MAKSAKAAKSKEGASEATDLAELGRDEFKRCVDGSEHNHKTYEDDTLFARDEQQWPENVRKQREDDGRPVLTINKLAAFGKQVVNDARQNKPSPKVHPVDSEGDPETAEIFNGIIRNIEYTSSADVAYDTGIECAVWGGFGYWRIGLDYSCDDTFDQDITVKRVPNPLSIYGDPNSIEADSSDWDVAFVVDWLTTKQFEDAYGDKSKVDWEADSTWADAKDWHDADGVQIAEWWSRKTVDRPIVLLSNGWVRDKASLENDQGLIALLQTGTVTVQQERVARSYEVRQRIMSGVEVLKDTKWLGKYIPIVPVYGDEFNIKGKRYLRSLIHPAVDAQRMFNYWRSVTAEVAAYTPRIPYVGAVGSFATDPNWGTANTKSHPFLEYDVVAGSNPPQRQPLDMGTAAGAMQEALSASDDMKSTIGMYDASLGARSNEVSGRAIMARQREGDVATFHFSDNLTRAITHTGRIFIDLIPKVYTTTRLIRVIGEDGKHSNAAIGRPDEQGQPPQPPNGPDGQPMSRIYDLSAGKYDLVVKPGPSYTTRRQEAAAEMTEMIRAFPAAAPVIGPEMAKNLDWPGADEIARKLEAMTGGGQPEIPPEIQQAIEQGKQTIADLTKQVEDLKSSEAADLAKIASNEKIKTIELQSNEKVERDRIASNERIANEKITSEAKLTLIKSAQVMSTTQPPPSGQPAR